MTEPQACSVTRGGGQPLAAPKPSWIMACLLVVLAAPFATAQGFSSMTLGALLNGRFVENAGQWPDDVRFATCVGQARLWVGQRGMTFLVADDDDAPAHVIAFEIEVMGESMSAMGADPLPWTCSFMRGADPDCWVAGAPAFQRVVIEASDGGVRLTVRPSGFGADLDLEVDPELRPAGMTLRISVPVAECMPTGAAGRIAALGPVRQQCHACGSDLACAACAGGLRWMDGGQLRWLPARLPGASSAQASIGLTWSTFLAGESSDRIRAVGFASDGSVVFGGNSFSMDFPATPGSFDPTHAPPNPQSFNYDIVVGRLKPGGSELAYATFLGGEANDNCYELAVAAGDEVVVVGQVSSVDYPTTPGAHDTTYSGTDVVITRLTGDGAALVYSTFLGGSTNEQPLGMALGADESVLVVGETYSSDYPVTPGAYDTSFFIQPNVTDGVVTRLAPDGASLLFSTFLGASGSDHVDGIAEAADGSVVVGGRAGGADFPTTPGSLQAEPASFVARLAGDGSALLWSTFFGGTASHDLRDVAVDSAGNVTVVGTLNFVSPPDTWFPTTEGSFDPSWNGNPDAFVARIDPTGTELLWSTLLGGSGQDNGWDVVLDPSGVVTVFGATRSGDFPVTAGAYDEVHNFDWDFFAARLSPEGDRLFYSTFMGGSKEEPYLSGKEADGAVDLEGEVVLAGSTRSPDYPTSPDAFDVEPHLATGGTDGVLTRLTLLPAGVTGHGSSTPGCSGMLTIGVTALPQIGSEEFGVWCGGAQPLMTRGFLGVALLPLEAPLVAAGLLLWLDPASLIMLPVTSDATGYCELPIRIEADPALVGLGAWAQFFWQDPCGPSGWAASRALGITVQP